jgi:hypothetical protein
MMASDPRILKCSKPASSSTPVGYSAESILDLNK